MSVILSQLRWPSLAQDLAVMMVPGTPLTELTMIYQTYGIKDSELKEILTVPAFQRLFKQSLDAFQSQGNKAGAVYRASSLAQSLSEKLYRDASTDKMEAKDAIKLLELLLKAAGLNDASSTQVNVQNNIGVSLPLPQGLKNPKLQHTYAPPPEKTLEVIDVV